MINSIRYVTIKKSIMAEVISSYRTSDGQELFYRTWGGRDTVPCLIFVHGIESHSGWFSEAGEKLTGYGLEVFALDRRGSGLNKEGRGDLSDFRRLSQDIDDFFIQKKLSGRKCVLLGLCWGAKVALYFFLLHPERVSGIIFVTPGLKTRLQIPLFEKIRWLRALLFAPNAVLSLPIKPEMFTDDPMYLKRIREDNLRLKNITTGFFRENLRLERAVRKSEKKFDIPCFLFLAGEDEIVDNNGVIKFLKRYFTNMETITYSGCRHGLFFEPCREKVIKDLAGWVV